jgi:hypothetical protein
VAIVVVGGSGKDVGKTALVCAVIGALREFAWTAVKIRGHDYGPESSGETTREVWEETQAGQETDTARYLAAGARRALLVTRRGAEVPGGEIGRAIGADRNVIFESNRMVDVLKPDVCLALMGEGAEEKPSFLRLLRAADAVVSVGGEARDGPAGGRGFRLQTVDQLSAEMVEWLRGRLGAGG